MAEFASWWEEFENRDYRVVALSADGSDDAEEMVKVEGIPFPVGYGLSPADVRERYGARLGEEDEFVQPTGYILDPEGIVRLSVYSDGRIGRLNAEEALRHIRALERRREET